VAAGMGLGSPGLWSPAPAMQARPGACQGRAIEPERQLPMAAPPAIHSQPSAGYLSFRPSAWLPVENSQISHSGTSVPMFICTRTW